MTDKSQNLKKITPSEIQSQEKTKNQNINIRNQRKLLPSITKENNSSSNSKSKNKTKDNIIEDFNSSYDRTKSSSSILLTESMDFIKTIKQAKELKDLEKIYAKWNNEKELSGKKKEESIKIEIYNNKKENSNNNINFNKKKHNEKNEEKKKMLEKLKLYQKQKAKRLYNENSENNENIDLRKIEKSMKKHLNTIYEKSDIILKKDFKIDNLKTEEFIEILEYIIDISKYHDKEIKVDQNNNLLLPEDAIEYKDNSIIKVLGYFGSELSLNNVNVYIEKIPTDEILREITFKIITSGLATHKVYKIFLDNDDYGIMFNEDIEKWFVYLDNIKRRISLIFNVSSDLIYIFGHNLYTYEAYILIYGRKIKNLEKILKNFDLKAESTILLNNIILSPCLFDINFCKNEDEWPEDNLIRGGKKYYPPYGWIGIALNLKDRYNKDKENEKNKKKDKGKDKDKKKDDEKENKNENENKKDDNVWLGKKNVKGEWPVAYHGIGKGNIFKKVLNIINNNLKPGSGQLYKYHLNVEKNRDLYNNVGEGVYLCPNIKEAMKYAESITLGANNLLFKFVIMARVNPEKIRSPGGPSKQIDWILNGNDEEIRPYRLLIKILPM